MRVLNPPLKLIGTGAVPRQTPDRQPRRLGIEILEDRTVPSFVFTTIDVPGATLTDINGINNSGQIVGSYTAAGLTHGFLLSDDDYITLDVPGATSTAAWDINDAGEIAGSYIAGGATHAFVLSDGTFTTFDFPGSTRTMPRGISDSGAIVGEYTASGVLHGFLLAGGEFTTIDVPGATFTSYASEINNAGEIVGRFDIPGTNSGFVLSGGTFAEIVVPGTTSSAALGINDSGQIVGGYTAGGIRHGYLLNEGDYTPFDVPDSTFTTPRKINDSGLIVGGYGSGGTTHGFITTAEPAARVESVVVNDGSAQRSMVTSLTVTFDHVVTLEPGAFELRRLDGSQVSLNVAASVAGGRSVAVLTFTGSDIIGGSLADGNYALTVRSDLVHDGMGRALDGDGDGVAGGDRSDSLFRLYGDSDGDRDVDLHDLGRFLGTIGRRPGDPHYLAYFDVNGDDRVGVIDTLALALRLGTRLKP
jgi:uncharacterized membrane protein